MESNRALRLKPCRRTGSALAVGNRRINFVEKEEKKVPTYMEEKTAILETMKKAGEPLNAGKIAELTGLDRKIVDKAMTAMKKEGSIVSPIRCKWEPAEK